ncbi:MAG: hypothetical protein ACR2MG_06080 [Pyrinomonadaceae bacterium]
MKPSIHKIFTIVFLGLIFFALPQFVLAQEKLLGDLTIESSASASGEQFVTINGERVISGRSIMSPAEIETPAQTTAKISLAKTGIIKIAPNSKMSLYFDNASISGDFLQGNLTVDALPFTKFNILTADGAITASNLTQENVFVVNLVNNKTQVKTLTGEVLFNGILLAAGQTYPNVIGNTNSTAKKDDNAGGSGSSNIILITLGVIGAVAVVAALSLSGGNNNNSTVSPTR